MVLLIFGPSGVSGELSGGLWRGLGRFGKDLVSIGERSGEVWEALWSWALWIRNRGDMERD